MTFKKEKLFACCCRLQAIWLGFESDRQCLPYVTLFSAIILFRFHSLFLKLVSVSISIWFCRPKGCRCNCSHESIYVSMYLLDALHIKPQLMCLCTLNKMLTGVWGPRWRACVSTRSIFYAVWKDWKKVFLVVIKMPATLWCIAHHIPYLGNISAYSFR